MAISNVSAPNNRAVKYGKQKSIELKGEIDKTTIIIRDFNTQQQKIGKNLVELCLTPSLTNWKLISVDSFIQQSIIHIRIKHIQNSQQDRPHSRP